ncbi:hypothetical protein [Streptomyces sp. NPDC059874]|uniref:hypothetical protein n=1 Tax=Streptomyces sp. NPDC059874 TaxID=3346983 RepID=UPI003660B0F6
MTDQWWMRVETAGNRSESHAAEKPATVTLCGQSVTFPLGGNDMPTCEECAYAVVQGSIKRDFAQVDTGAAASAPEPSVLFGYCKTSGDAYTHSISGGQVVCEVPITEVTDGPPNCPDCWYILRDRNE